MIAQTVLKLRSTQAAIPEQLLVISLASRLRRDITFMLLLVKISTLHVSSDYKGLASHQCLTGFWKSSLQGNPKQGDIATIAWFQVSHLDIGGFQFVFFQMFLKLKESKIGLF